MTDERIHKLENALRWIRLQAGIHYYGEAFEPEHMRAIANMAADALSNVPLDVIVPDYYEVMGDTIDKALDEADKLWEVLGHKISEELDGEHTKDD